MSEKEDQEIRWLLEVLSTVVRVAGRSRQSVEEQAGLSSGYLSKILGGTVELRARHILLILESVGMHPADFFRLAYPQPEPPGESDDSARRLIENVRAALGREEAREPQGLTPFDEQVKAALGRLLGLTP